MGWAIVLSSMVGTWFGWVLCRHYGPIVDDAVRQDEEPPMSLHDMVINGYYRHGVFHPDEEEG